MPGRQVQQSTFDAIVREAIEDFDLSPDEAIADAREQLKKAGVTDFSNLSATLLSHSDQQHEGVVLPTQLEAAIKSFEIEPLISVLTRLAARASESREVAGVAGSNNVISLVSHVLEKAVTLLHQDDSYEQLVRVTTEAVAALCVCDEVNRTKFVNASRHNGLTSLIKLLAILPQKNWKADETHTAAFDASTFVSAIVAMTSVQRQNERVKRSFASGDSLNHLLSIINRTGLAILQPKPGGQLETLTSLFTKLALLIRQMLTADDNTSFVPETFNRAKVLGGSKVVTESGLKPLSSSTNILQILHKVCVGIQASPDLSTKTKLRILTDCIHTVRLVAVSDENCAELMKLCFQEVALDAMKSYHDSTTLVQVCMALLRNLAGRDQCKTPIFQEIGVVQEVAEQYVTKSPKVAEQYCSLISSLCLRRTDLSRQVMQKGMMTMMLEAMLSHSEVSSVQRAGCIAIRNICARDEELRSSVRKDRKVETAVRSARKLFPVECEEVAYCALRDMDVLREDELRRDARYTMPAGFYNMKIVRPTP